MPSPWGSKMKGNSPSNRDEVRTNDDCRIRPSVSPWKDRQAGTLLFYLDLNQWGEKNSQTPESLSDGCWRGPMTSWSVVELSNSGLFRVVHCRRHQCPYVLRTTTNTLYRLGFPISKPIFFQGQAANRMAFVLQLGHKLGYRLFWDAIHFTPS